MFINQKQKRYAISDHVGLVDNSRGSYHARGVAKLYLPWQFLTLCPRKCDTKMQFIRLYENQFCSSGPLRLVS